MPSYRTGPVVRILEERPGLQRVEVDLGEGPERAYTLLQLTGPVASGAVALNAAATAGSWLCSAATTTGMPSIDSTSASSARCSSALPTSAWMLV